jgi:outer membrane protein OmpA-like peptidoglycan-associated protein
MKSMKYWIGFGLVAAACSVQAADESLFERAPWTVSGGLTYLGFEGDEVVQSGTAFSLKLGYSFNARWDVETGIEWAPSLDNTEFTDERYHLDGSTWLFRFPVDFLFHLRNTKDLHWDPYLSAGGGLTVGEESFGDSQADLYVSGGGGLAYHFNDEWALRGEARAVQSFQQNEFGWEGGLAVNWRWGARAAPEFQLMGGELDSDGEGLSDEFEKTIGTDPFKPDTDGDGLTDFEEVRTFMTDPLNPDSDYDGLSDGAEVHTYQTNPLKTDTDDGGVADGHEVIEDGTNPLDPSDDLQLFTLNIEFDYDKADLRPQDFDELDIVAKVLQRNPNATARIEGHADKRKKSKRDYNLKLSQRRAEAVLAYLADIGGIQRSRMTAHGYGFDRPLAPNDTEANMQKNRRTEIYIRKDGIEPAAP